MARGFPLKNKTFLRMVGIILKNSRSTWAYTAVLFKEK